MRRLCYRIGALTKKKARRTSPSPRSLKVTDAFKTFVLEQLADLEDLTARAMFGGVGLYARGDFFGIIARDRLYLKVDDVNRPDYERMGSRPFKPYPDRSGTMQYCEVPVSVLESALELSAWARKAIAVARRR
jgi:DNA transformation protein